MKKELLVLTVALGMAAALSANGQQDEASDFFGRGRANGSGRGFNYDAAEAEQFQADRQAERQAEIDSWIEDQEPVTVEGTLHLVNGELPYVEQNGEKFVISAPWADLEDISLTDGMTVTVEGFEAPGAGYRWDDSEKVLMLTKATVNGEEITIEHSADGSGYRGGAEQAYGNRGGRAMAQGGPVRGKGGPSAGGMMGRRF